MDGVQGYHLVQSFAEGELTPELAHRIGLELAERLLHGQYPAVVATHLNTHCLHNHIVWDSVAMDTGRKYRSSARTYYTEVRAESDRLCRQHGLSVIESPESERGKKQYGKWLAEQNGKPTWRTAIRQDVDSAIAASLTWRQFVKALEGQGYELRMQRKYPTLRPPGKERCVRFKTLGKQYTPEAIRMRILYPRRRVSAEGKRQAGPRVQYARLRTTAGLCAGSPACGRCITATCMSWARCPKSRYIPAMRCGRISGSWISMWNRCGSSRGTGSTAGNSWRNTVSRCSTRSRR